MLDQSRPDTLLPPFVAVILSAVLSRSRARIDRASIGTMSMRRGNDYGRRAGLRVIEPRPGATVRARMTPRRRTHGGSPPVLKEFLLGERIAQVSPCNFARRCRYARMSVGVWAFPQMA